MASSGHKTHAERNGLHPEGVAGGRHSAVVGMDARVAALVHAALTGADDSDRFLLVLFSLALASHGSLFLELGVKDGNSTLPLLAAAAMTGGKLISVDHTQTSFTPPGDLACHWEFRKQDALEFLAQEARRFDLVFVDDWHAADHVATELERLDRLVGPGSLILLHDTMHGHTEPFYNVDLSIKDGQWQGGGPARAMMELDPLRWEWATLPWWHGLSIIRKKHSKLYYPR